MVFAMKGERWRKVGARVCGLRVAVVAAVAVAVVVEVVEVVEVVR